MQRKTTNENGYGVIGEPIDVSGKYDIVPMSLQTHGEEEEEDELSSLLYTTAAIVAISLFWIAVCLIFCL